MKRGITPPRRRATGEGETVARIAPASSSEPPDDLHLLKTQAERVRRMSEWLRTQPIIVTGPWTRDELYERR